MIDDYRLDILTEPLQNWYREHARVLPWRSDPTPYHVWISEIMLQQTRVEAVKPYYVRFLESLPDVKALAECPEERYLKLWEGLGYYSRVRNMHRAAQQIMEEYGGRIPGEYEQLLKLKGIGHYTAGAISSIAFGNPVPAVDGNVLRVLTRVTGDDTDINKQSFRNHMEDLLTGLMKESTGPAKNGESRLNPSTYNQALMELGAMVCVPGGKPHCEVCPWETFCRARAEGRISELPVKKKAGERRVEEKTVLIIKDREKTALHKRPDTGLLAGLYELPNKPGWLTEEEVREYIRSMGLTPVRIEPLQQAKHVFSHVEWHMTGFMVRVEKQSFLSEEQKNKALEEIFFEKTERIANQYAVPSAFSAYMKLLSNDHS